jgi:hypothetical protein
MLIPISYPLCDLSQVLAIMDMQALSLFYSTKITKPLPEKDWSILGQ